MVTEAAALPLRARALAVPATAALAVLVGASSLVRFAAGLLRPTPVLNPDEYLYAELARSIAESGRPLVRGETATFPGLLEPVLAAPFWLAGDPELAYRLTQALHAGAMSLAAVPVYLLARLLGLRPGMSLACAAVAVAAPGLAYSGYVLSDPIGYPLALAAVYAGVRTIGAPSARGQVAFLALAGLATLARLQYAALVAAFLVAALVVERGRPRRFALSLGLTAAAAAGLAAAGPASTLGAYWSAVTGGVDVAGVLSWLPSDSMLLAYAVGWILAAPALAGLAAALLRPRSRAERAFAALAAVLAACLLLGAAFVAEIDAHRFQERYLIALAPLAAVAAATLWSRGRGARRAAAALALGLLVVSVQLPISSHTVGTWISDSPTLWAARLLQRSLGVADGPLLIAVLASGLALLAVAAALRPDRFAGAAMAAAVAACAALSVGAHALDVTNSRAVFAETFPDGSDWIDRTGLEDVALLQPRPSSRQHALMHLLWNDAVDDVLLLPGARPPDPFARTEVDVDGRGRLVAAGRPVRRPLLVDGTGAIVELEGARPVARADTFTLWRPGADPRVSMLAVGRYDDGWLAPEGSIRLFPDGSGRTAGVLRLDLESLPRHFGLTGRVRLFGPGVGRLVTLAPGTTRRLRIAVDVAGPFELRWLTSGGVFSGGRVVAAGASRPVFERD